MSRLPVMLLLLAMPLLAAAQAGGDLQAQIDYAYQTEDVNALANLEASLRAKLVAGEGDAAAHYHLAHAAYRHALLAASLKAGAAGHAASLCVDELKTILRHDQHNAEALLLQSACYGLLAESSPIEAVLLRRLAAERLNEALHLAPRNPRALLIAAQSAPDPEQSLAQLRLAAEAFGQSSATAAETPGWGDAEAYLALGREMQRRGDALGARNWIERALIASPDYKAAQRAQLELVGH
jgi:hypothetical protein